MSLQNFEQVYLTEERQPLNHNQAFFGQRGKGKGHRGGRGNFKGRGHNSFTQNRPHNNNQPLSFQHQSKSNNNNWKGQPSKQNTNQVAYQICGRTNHTAVKCYYRYTMTQKEKMSKKFL